MVYFQCLLENPSDNSLTLAQLFLLVSTLMLIMSDTTQHVGTKSYN